MINRWNGRAALIFSVIVCCLMTASMSASAASTDYQPIEDPDGNAMLSFYQRLAQTERGEAITRIIHYGDSHAAADILTSAIRRNLQQWFGDAGTGFVLAGRPWSWYSRAGVASRASAGWQVDGLGPISNESDGRFGLAGVSLSADQPGEWVKMTAVCQRLDIYLLKQPGGGAVDILLDGVTYQRGVELSSNNAAPAYVEIDAETDSVHSLEIRATERGRVRVLGIVIERGTSGVVYDVLGINGARATRLLFWDWRLLASNLQRRDPDLIIVAYGSNEVGDHDLDIEDYKKSFSILLNQLRAAAPSASLLVLSPPDRAVRAGTKWHALARLPALVAAQRKASLESGAAFWNLFKAMGGTGSIDRWARRKQPLAQADRVHLTPQGYQIVGDMLFEELMRGYLKSVVVSR